MTELLCHTDSYVQEFDATVVAVDTTSSAVVLDRTAFYPGGGGQPHDLGWLLASGETPGRHQGGAAGWTVVAHHRWCVTSRGHGGTRTP